MRSGTALRFLASGLTAVLVLTACGGDEDNDPAEETAADSDDEAPEGEDGDGSTDEAPDDAEETTEEFEPVTIDVVFPTAQADIANAGWDDFVAAVDASGANVTFNIRGGPEVIPPDEMPDAVINGTIGLTLTPTAYLPRVAPVAQITSLSPYTPWEEREDTPIYDMYFDAFQENGLIYLGAGMANVRARLYTTEPLESADLSGLSIRTTPAVAPMIEALGGAPASIPLGETYTAVQRGVVDGLTYVDVGPEVYGFEEVIQYEIDPPIYDSRQAIIMSPVVWDQLAPGQQELLIDATAEAERAMYDRFTELRADTERILAEAGVEVLTLPPDEAEAFVGAFIDTSWERVLEANPELEAFRTEFDKGR